jgi:uncharacterized membrane protein
MLSWRPIIAPRASSVTSGMSAPRRAEWSERMAHAENSVTIERPAYVVFEFVLDGTKNALWRPAVLSVERTSGAQTGVGATYRQQLKGPGGRPIAGDYEIVACQPSELIQFRVTAGPARPTGEYRFVESGQSTTVTFTLDYKPTGFARLMDPMIAQTMRSEVATLANLKAYLERQSA